MTRKLIMLLTVAALVTSFLEWCGRHRAPSTVRSYGGRLKSFVREFGDREWSTVKPLEVDAWLARACLKRNGTPMAPDSERLTMVSFERLQKWVVENKLELAPLVAQPLEKPRGRQRDRIPTEDETGKLLEHASPAFREIYQALRLCGARPAELCAARIEDLDPALGAIVLAKHKTARKVGKARVIPVGQKLSELIGRVIAGRTEGPIFRDDKGREWTSGRLSKAYSKLRDKAGLARDLVLYLARHEHATAMVRAFGLDAAAKALGHMSVTTTQRYSHLRIDEMRSNQDALEL